MTGQAPRIIAHRGSSGTHPENTLAAFRAGLEAGADGTELDVHQAHGRLWVIHDARLERTTNGHGSLDATGSEALRRLDAGDGERIPWLDEVLELLPPGHLLNVEIKGSGCGVAAWALCRERRAAEDLLFSSFDHRQLHAIRDRDPDARLAPLFGRRSDRDPLEVAAELGAWSINVPAPHLAAPLVNAAHQAGLAILVYTVNEPAGLRQACELGVDGVFTDFPALARREFSALARR